MALHRESEHPAPDAWDHLLVLLPASVAVLAAIVLVIAGY